MFAARKILSSPLVYRAYQSLRGFGSQAEAVKKLTLIITPHPCGAVPDAVISDPEAFKAAVSKPYERPTVHEEVQKYHGLFQKFWNLAGKTAPLKLKNWVAKESDRNPNQPCVILYGVAMDHEKMTGLYRGLLSQHDIHSEEATDLLRDIRRQSKFLKREAKLEAAVTCVLEPDTEHANHYLTQFFSVYTPVEYLGRRSMAVDEFQSRSAQLLKSLEDKSNALVGLMNESIVGLEAKEAEDIGQKISLLPPWGAMTQGRLPAEEVISTVEEILEKNQVTGPVSEHGVMRAIENSQLIEVKDLSPEARNMCRFYEVYHELGVGGRMSEVVLANYQSHLAVMCSHFLSLKMKQPEDKSIPSIPLAEDTVTLRNMADDMEALYSRPYFQKLALNEGVFFFIARSDTTRSAGIPSGNFEVLACAKETVDRIASVFAEEQPKIDLTLGQGSSPARGLYFNPSQYFLPFSHPNLEAGITIQPGPGQSRFASTTEALKSIREIYAMNEESERQAIREKQFDSSFIRWMRQLEAPGEIKLQAVLTDPNSWYNEFITHSELTQTVLDRALGSRWKKQEAEKTAPFNETQRAITVFALTKEIGFPIHTAIPFVYSMRAFLAENTGGLPFLAEMYQTNVNYLDHIHRIHQCLLDGNEALIKSSDASKDQQEKMIGLLQESNGYLRKITSGSLPDNCPYKEKKREAFLLRQQAKEEQVARYSAFDYPLGTYA